jgi:hypothetical protein
MKTKRTCPLLSEKAKRLDGSGDFVWKRNVKEEQGAYAASLGDSLEGVER